MSSIILGGKEYERRELDAVEEAFYSNFVCRRLVAVYGIPLASITAAQIQYVLHDLNAVRYRAWLVLRHHGLNLEQIGQLVTDENAVDVFAALWRKADGVASLDLVNADRIQRGLPPLGNGEPVKEESAA